MVYRGALYGFAQSLIYVVVLVNLALSEEEGYYGQIREDAPPGTPVEITGRASIYPKNVHILQGDRICGYTVYKTHSELPFEVQLLNYTTGQARIVLSDSQSLNYERRHRYRFEVAAHGCTNSMHTDREWIHVEVEDVNEHSPRLSKDSYMVEVVEGRLYDEILRLQPQDADGSTTYSTICHYNILTDNVPFRIDSDGVLYNIEQLDYSDHHNYILIVRVEDCGGKQARASSEVVINVAVKKACKPGWTGIPDQVNFIPGAGKVLIGENAELSTCESNCEASQITTKISLSTKHIGKGCDRDTYSIQSQRKLCGASASSVDLLPSPSMGGWTEPLHTDDGKESDEIFYFNGTDAITIPESKFNHTLDGHFTISTWMKHSQLADAENDHHGPKEHLLCNADGEEMNRHHYSLFVHNCRLVLLLRQESHGNDLNVFKPAEWRWKLSEVCDGQWHHYAVSVDFPQVRLYVDGDLIMEKSKEAEIIDDWPLHPTKKIHYTKLVVGACHQGSSNSLSSYFTGYLAGLTILRGKTESDRVIQCLNDCKEKLDFHAMDEMETGMSVAFNSEMTEITISGHNRSEVAHLVQRIGYINSRVFPTPGHRALKITTDVTCAEGETVNVPVVDSQVTVQQRDNPIITIDGQEVVSYSESALKTGQLLIGDVRIASQNAIEEQNSAEKQETTYDEEVDDLFLLDFCKLAALPRLNLEDEHFKWPSNLMAQLGLQAMQSEDGLVITGADKVQNYAMVLRKILYVALHPEDFNSRNFVLTCSELNGRFVSNSFKIRLDVIHPVHHASVPQAHIESNKLAAVQQQFQQLSLAESNVAAAVNTASGAGVGVTIIVVVCVGFLMFMIVLGVVRIRAAHQRNTGGSSGEEAERGAEMEWDNSALSIIVNPMDQQAMYEETQELTSLRGAEGVDTDSEDDDDMSDDYHDEEDEDDDEELDSSEDEEVVMTGTAKRRDLEWDDSTLNL